MGKHRLDGSRHMEGDLTDLPDLPEEPKTFERDSAPVQGFEYFGVDTRDEEDDK